MLNTLRQVSRFSLITSTNFCQANQQLGLLFKNNRTLETIKPSSKFQIRQVTLGGPPKMAARALVIVADGTEEMEAVILADVLRRGKVATTIAGLNSANPVKCSCGVNLVPDMSLDEALKNDYDAVVLPGGAVGSESFCAVDNPVFIPNIKSTKVGELLKKQEAANKYCVAICAAPTAFKQHGIGAGKAITSYPSMAEKFKGTDYKYIDNQPVVVDGKLVTSRGPGTSFALGLKLVELLVDKKTSDEIKDGMLVQ